MRALILYHIYSGDVWFTGLALAIVAVGIDLVLGERWMWRPAARITFVLAPMLAALAGVPSPVWYVLFSLVVWAAYLRFGFGATKRRTAAAVAAGSLVVIAALGIVLEGAALRSTAVDGDGSCSTLVVFGDSLSSGGFDETVSWVELVRRRPIEVINLSQPSATTGSALELQLPEMPKACGTCCVLFAVGGNDMLDGVDSWSYEKNLRRLAGEARDRGAVVWLLEFPVLPGKWRWAAIQREVARELDLHVIPRRALARVLTDPDATTDGLHLSDEGHHALAGKIVERMGL